MKVGLIGFFNAGAYSDDLIEHVTKKLLSELNDDVTFDSTLLQVCNNGTAVSYLNRFDLIVHAGGSLLGKCTHFPVRDITAWKDLVKTPLAIFGPGYRLEPDKEPLNLMRRRRLQTFFDRAEVISVRGHMTVRYLKMNDIDISKIDSVGDPVMACGRWFKTNPKYIMGNVRSMPSEEIQHASTDRVHRVMAEIYDWLIEHYELPLKLVSFRHNVPDDNDIKGALAVKKLMKHGGDVDIIYHPSFSDALNSMKQAAFWFGQRLHPTIFAAVHGIPFVGVEYQFDKMLDWASTVGIDNYIHTADATLDAFIEKFNNVPDNIKRLRNILPTRIDEINKISKKIMELIF